MDCSEYIGQTFEARTHIRLPRGRYVAPGETFRLLAMHVERGCRPDLWLAAGNAALVDDRPQRVPPPGKGIRMGETRAARRARERAEREAAELAAGEPEPADDGANDGGGLPPDDDGSGAPDFPPAETVEA